MGKSCCVKLLEAKAYVIGIDLNDSAIDHECYTHFKSDVLDEKKIEECVKASFDIPEVRAQSEALIPNGRLGMPEGVSSVVLFLLSDMSDYVTGSMLFADGGYHLQK